MSSNLVSRVRLAALIALVVLAGGCGSDDKTDDVSASASTSSSAAPTTVTTSAPETTVTTAAAAASTTTAKPAPSTTAHVAKTYKYTKADSGKTVTVAAGDKLEVTLEECAGCGYQWRQTAAPDAKVLQKTGDESTPAQNQPGMVGGSGTHIFRYQAAAAGTTSFKLGYFGPGNDKPDESFTLTVKVA